MRNHNELDYSLGPLGRREEVDADRGGADSCGAGLCGLDYRQWLLVLALSLGLGPVLALGFVDGVERLTGWHPPLTVRTVIVRVPSDSQAKGWTPGPGQFAADLESFRLANLSNVDEHMGGYALP